MAYNLKEPAIIYSWSVTDSVINTACYNIVVKYQLMHDFLVYEF